MSGGLYGNASLSAADTPALPMRWRVLRAMATLAALAVLMLVIADVGWRWLAPASKGPAPAARDNDSPAATINATPWFGASATQDKTATVAPSANGLSGDARLLGIIAGRNGSGYALFRFPDRGPVLIATGQEIASGVTLQAITDSGIRVLDRGEARDIALRPTPATNASKDTNAASPRLAARAGNAAACMPPGGGSSGPVYRLNAELLTGIAAKPDSWSNAFNAGTDGLAVREGNAFGAMLGMKPGDRVTQANGIALRGTQDVLVAVIRPLLASQAVRITGVRDGQPAQWIFVNASACPA